MSPQLPKGGRPDQEKHFTELPPPKFRTYEGEGVGPDEGGDELVDRTRKVTSEVMRGTNPKGRESKQEN